VELSCDDEEVKLRAHQMRLNPDDNIVYSKWDREERKKPKILLDDDGEPIDDDDENAIKPFKELELVHRVNDTEELMAQ